MVGTLLMAAMAVSLTVGVTTLWAGSWEGPLDPLRADLSLTLAPGDGGYGTGDEHLVIHHRGGEPAPLAVLRLSVEVGGASFFFGEGGSPLDHAGEDAFDAASGDGTWYVGERWTSPPMTLPAETLVAVDAVSTSPMPHVFWSATARGSS